MIYRKQRHRKSEVSNYHHSFIICNDGKGTQRTILINLLCCEYSGGGSHLVLATIIWFLCFEPEFRRSSTSQSHSHAVSISTNPSLSPYVCEFVVGHRSHHHHRCDGQRPGIIISFYYLSPAPSLVSISRHQMVAWFNIRITDRPFNVTLYVILVI